MFQHCVHILALVEDEMGNGGDTTRMLCTSFLFTYSWPELSYPATLTIRGWKVWFLILDHAPT